MKIERFEVPGLAQYSYVVSSQGEAVAIDPIRDVDRYTEYAAANRLRFVAIAETHIHADFASGSTALAAATGAELALSACDEGELYEYAMPHRELRDGDALAVGDLRLRALHTPGHTPEHLSFVLYDLKRSANEPVALFSGDFLFVGGVGRPDLLGDDAKLALAHELFRSLHERLAALPDGVHVYPGHGAGSLCGAGMGERPETTLGYERAASPLLQLGEEAFVQEILASVPPMPAYYPRMKRLNAAGAAPLAEVPGGNPLSPQALTGLAAQGAIVLDLRRPEAFGGAHIPGSINIGAAGNLSLWAGWLLDAGRPIVLVGENGDDEAARRGLIRVGLDRIAGFLDRGIRAWIEDRPGDGPGAGLDFARTQQLSAGEVARRPAHAVVDVRSEREWSAGHIEGARHIMLGDLPKRLHELPKDAPLVMVCGSGYRSSIAASLLQAHGFAEASSLLGGMSAWKRREAPREPQTPELELA